MLALILSGECIAIVDSTDGHDLTGVTVIDAPENPEEWRYVGGAWVARPKSLPEQDDEALSADARWAAIISATPAQIDNWLDANVTDLASVRRVLRVLILVARKRTR